MGDTRNVVVIPWRERAGGGGELTSRNVAARIGSKVETRVRLDCHPESILITATSQPLFLRRCTTGLFLLDRERERERGIRLSRIEIDGLARREFRETWRRPEQTHPFPSLPPVESWDRVREASFETRGGGERKNFAKKVEENSPLVHFSRFLWESASRASFNPSSSPPPSGPGCWTISSPLKLNSRSIRPLGRFCSNGNEINASFKCSPAPPWIVSAFFLRLSADQVRGRVSFRNRMDR